MKAEDGGCSCGGDGVNRGRNRWEDNFLLSDRRD